MTSINGLLLKLDVNAIIENTDRKVDISAYERKKANVEARIANFNAKRREFYHDNIEFCREKARLSKLNYRRSNRELANSTQRVYYAENIERLREYNRNYYAQNRDKCISKQRSYYERNKEKINAKNAIYMREYRARKKAEKQLANEGQPS